MEPPLNVIWYRKTVVGNCDWTMPKLNDIGPGLKANPLLETGVLRVSGLQITVVRTAYCTLHALTYTQQKPLHIYIYIYIYMYITIHMHTHIIHTSHRLIVRVYICLHTVVICHCLLCCILLCCLLSIVIEYASILPFSSVLPTYFRWRLATEHREREGEICGDMYIYIYIHIDIDCMVVYGFKMFPPSIRFRSVSQHFGCPKPLVSAVENEPSHQATSPSMTLTRWPRSNWQTSRCNAKETPGLTAF